MTRLWRSATIALTAFCVACSGPADTGTESPAPSTVVGTPSTSPLDPFAFAALDASVACAEIPDPASAASESSGAPTAPEDLTTGLSVPGARGFDTTLPPQPIGRGENERYVAVLKCGDGWYPISDSIVVIGPGPRVVAEVGLPSTKQRDERAVVDAVTPTRRGAVVRWHTTSGCCSHLVEWEAELDVAAAGQPALSKPRLVIRDETVDVTRFNHADFTHPSGKASCSMNSGDDDEAYRRTLCTSNDLPALLPHDFCDELSGVGVNAITVTSTATFLCGGDVAAWPPISDYNNWSLSTDFATLNGQGPSGDAVLPVGVTLKSGIFACTSHSDGLRCKNSETGAAIWISARGDAYSLEEPVDPKAARFLN